MSDKISTSCRNPWPDYAAFWRWHFYAGVFCIPFVLVLSVTGTIYLFRPQIEAWQDRRFDQLVSKGAIASLPDQVRAAVRSVDGSVFANCELPTRGQGEVHCATRVVVRQNGLAIRVYVDPVGPQVLHSVVENERFIRVVRRIHGELLLGKRGSYLVELAASWTIFMVVTGMGMWWPRRARFAGVVYPRPGQKGKSRWKELHSVGGFWASGLIVFLIATGLPWSTFWGDYFKWVRKATGTNVVVAHGDGGHRDGEHWDGGHVAHQKGGAETTGDTEEKARSAGGPSWRTPPPDPSSYQLDELVSVATFAETVDWLPPVLLLPPPSSDSVWTIKSETANRPHRKSIRYDVSAQQVVNHETFADRHWVDRVVGQGIALHEGQRFGLPNQLIALFATASLVMLSCTGILLWWRRRDGGWLSPPASSRAEPSTTRLAMVAIVGASLAVYLPLFGITLVGVLVLDRIAFRRNDTSLAV